MAGQGVFDTAVPPSPATIGASKNRIATTLGARPSLRVAMT